MTDFNRRDFLLTTGAVGATLMAPELGAQTLTNQPEKGAKLRLMRWKRFVAGDEEMWMQNTKKFTEKYGVEVRVDSESFEDIRPKAAVAANVGSGPDIILGWYDDAHLYPDKLLPLTDVAEYLGKKYGGWYDVCRDYDMRGKEWIDLPIGANGTSMLATSVAPVRSSAITPSVIREFPPSVIREFPPSVIREFPA